MRYDLHIHSCLSPCANDDMTPAAIAGFATLSGADIIAVCDHNSAKNLPAVLRACTEYGIMLLCGIEVTTAEEIHVLCYFKCLEDALIMSDEIYQCLPNYKADPSVWGRQLVMDENDDIIEEIPRLLTSACTMDIYDVFARCKELGGIAVPAHADKDSYSILSALGFAPDDLHFPIIELKDAEKYAELSRKTMLPQNAEIISSSDAHQLEDICSKLNELSESSQLLHLINYAK